MDISIRNLTKEYGAVKALNDVSLDIKDGELFFLLGPSGCGKTTLLRCLGGFEKPTAGSILMNGADVAGTPPNERDSAMVFQGYALWPHLTVRQNVAFGLEMKGMPAAERNARVEQVLRELQILELAERKPNQLSGGQQQRVALARTLVVHPGCLLLDEPLANLDAKLRRDMRQEIRRICKDNHLTTVYVTHDRAEALSMADRLAVFNGGRIVQCGTPREVYRRPVNAFVAGFLGDTNLVSATLVSCREDGKALLRTGMGELLSGSVPSGLAVGGEVLISMRPEAFRRCDDAASNSLEITLGEESYLGEFAECCGICADGSTLKFYEMNPGAGAEVGSRIRLSIEPDDVVCLRE
ncbi:MAG: ABC transporter ATP-binding protein [Victivallales bacterium]|nr:ABC transporter ATP-binding protein [Victivallales bacterium]